MASKWFMDSTEKAKRAEAFKRYNRAFELYVNRGMYTGDPDYPNAIEDITEDYESERKNIKELLLIN